MAGSDYTNPSLSANREYIATHQDTIANAPQVSSRSGGTSYSSVVAPSGAKVSETGTLTYTTDTSKVSITPQGTTTTQTYYMQTPSGRMAVSPAFAEKASSKEVQTYAQQEQSQAQLQQAIQQGAVGSKYGGGYLYEQPTNTGISTSAYKNYISSSPDYKYQTSVGKALNIRGPQVETQPQNTIIYSALENPIIRGSLLGIKDIFYDFPISFTKGFYNVAESALSGKMNPTGDIFADAQKTMQLFSNKDTMTFVGATTLAPIILSMPSAVVSFGFAGINYYEYSQNPSLESGARAISRSVFGTNIISDIAKLPQQIGLLVSRPYQPASELTTMEVASGASKFVTSPDLGIKSVQNLLELFRSSPYAKNLLDFGRRETLIDLPKILYTQEFGGTYKSGVVDWTKIDVSRSDYGQYSGAFTVSPISIAGTVELGQGKYMSVPFLETFRDIFGKTTYTGGQPVGSELAGVFGAPASSFYFGKAGSYSQTLTFSLFPRIEFGLPTVQFTKVAPENILPSQTNVALRESGKAYLTRATEQFLETGGKAGKSEAELQFAVPTQVKYLETPSYTIFQGSIFQIKVYQAIAPPKTISASIKQGVDTWFARQEAKASQSYSMGLYGTPPISSVSGISSSFKAPRLEMPSYVSSTSSLAYSFPSYSITSSSITSSLSEIPNYASYGSVLSKSLSSSSISTSNSLLSLSGSSYILEPPKTPPYRPENLYVTQIPMGYKRKRKKSYPRGLLEKSAIFDIKPDLLSVGISMATYGKATAPKYTIKQQKELAYQMQEGRMIFPTKELLKAPKQRKNKMFLNPTNLMK